MGKSGNRCSARDPLQPEQPALGAARKVGYQSSMRSLTKPLLDHWPLAAACASAAMLAAAHAFETFGHLAPCHLCFYQRDVYWWALAVGVVGFALGYMRFSWARR